MPAAGDIITVPTVPGSRVQTSTITSDSGTFTTSAVQIGSVTAFLLSSRIYRVRFKAALEITVDGVVRIQMHEDSTGGGTVQIRDFVVDASGTTNEIDLETEYSAPTVSGNKTFVVTGDVLAGGGTANINADPTFPSFFYIDFIRG